MAERYQDGPPSPENYEQKSQENLEKAPEQETRSPEKESPSRNEKRAEIQDIRHEAHEQAKSSSEMLENSLPKAEQPGSGPGVVNRELKEMAYQRLLTRARRRLPAYDRLMSHIIHQPVINAVSEATGRTVARPSGILGGGIVAFGGNLIYYLVAKHYGYEYNFLVFLFLISVGFVVGWSCELLWHLLRRKHKK